jgi:predicted O-methyltransferase YrrM
MSAARPSAAVLARRAIEHKAIQKQSELTGLLHLLERRRPQTVVEIGTEHGGTLWAWCQIAQPDALIVSIDLPRAPRGRGESEDQKTRKFLDFACARQTLRLLRLDSHEEETLEALKAVLSGRPIDFLFIDGDHAYNGVRLDYEMYSPLVRRGGLIAFHDILPHPIFAPEVERFWRSIRSDFKHVELLDAHQRGGGGIGILYAGIGTSRLPDAAMRLLSKAAMRLLSIGEGRLPDAVMRLLSKTATRLLRTAAVS